MTVADEHHHQRGKQQRKRDQHLPPLFLLRTNLARRLTEFSLAVFKHAHK